VSKTPFSETFDLLKAAWNPARYESLCVGQGLWSIGQWIAYCTHCDPVPLNVFEGMLGEAANRRRWMPAFESEAVWRAIDGMPDCEVKKMLQERRAKSGTELQ
jgi:hypothetical protein